MAPDMPELVEDGAASPPPPAVQPGGHYVFEVTYLLAEMKTREWR